MIATIIAKDELQHIVYGPVCLGYSAHRISEVIQTISENTFDQAAVLFSFHGKFVVQSAPPLMDDHVS